MYKSENEAQGIMFKFAYEKEKGFGFDDPGPALRYGSLTAPKFHYTLINTLSLALELRQNMRLTKLRNQDKS
jgi:hypothetical protein